MPSGKHVCLRKTTMSASSIALNTVESGLGPFRASDVVPTAEGARSGLILEDNGRRDYTLNSTTLGPTNGVQFCSTTCSIKNPLR